MLKGQRWFSTPISSCRRTKGGNLSFLLQPVEKATAEREREAERERDRHSPFGQRHLHTHHHTHVGMGYPLIPGQYDPFQGQQLYGYCAFVHSALENNCPNYLSCLKIKILSFELTVALGRVLNTGFLVFPSGTSKAVPTALYATETET